MNSLSSKWQRNILYTLVSLLASFICISYAYAQTPPPYEPLVGIPQIEGSGTGLSSYLNRLYMVTIAVGAILAFLRIAFAGVKYSLTDIVTDKGQAKSDIQNALLGLAILLIPFIVLNTIYPNLTNLNILDNVVKVDLTAPTYITPEEDANEFQRMCNRSGGIFTAPRECKLTVNPYLETYTKSSCEARAASVGGTAVFTPVSTNGTVDYGRCAINQPPAPTTPPTSIPQLLWESIGLTRTQCDAAAATRNGTPIHTEATGKCQVWEKQ